MATLMTKTTYHHGDLKNALFEAGLALLEEKGVDGLSLREMAKRAGVSHAAPYRHFSDKTELLSSIARWGFEELQEAIAEKAERYPNNPKKQLKEAGVAYVRLAVAHPERTRLMFGGVIPQEEFPESLADASEATFDQVLEIVEAGRRSGDFKYRDPKTMATAVWSQFHGLAMLILSGQVDKAHSDWRVKKLAEEGCELLLEGLQR